MDVQAADLLQRSQLVLAKINSTLARARQLSRPTQISQSPASVALRDALAEYDAAVKAISVSVSYSTTAPIVATSPAPLSTAHMGSTTVAPLQAVPATAAAPATSSSGTEGKGHAVVLPQRKHVQEVPSEAAAPISPAAHSGTTSSPAPAPAPAPVAAAPQHTPSGPFAAQEKSLPLPRQPAPVAKLTDELDDSVGPSSFAASLRAVSGAGAGAGAGVGVGVGGSATEAGAQSSSSSLTMQGRQGEDSDGDDFGLEGFDASPPPVAKKAPVPAPSQGTTSSSRGAGGVGLAGGYVLPATSGPASRPTPPSAELLEDSGSAGRSDREGEGGGEEEDVYQAVYGQGQGKGRAGAGLVEAGRAGVGGKGSAGSSAAYVPTALVGARPLSANTSARGTPSTTPALGPGLAAGQGLKGDAGEEVVPVAAAPAASIFEPPSGPRPGSATKRSSGAASTGVGGGQGAGGPPGLGMWGPKSAAPVSALGATFASAPHTAAAAPVPKSTPATGPAAVPFRPVPALHVGSAPVGPVVGVAAGGKAAGGAKKKVSLDASQLDYEG